MMLTWVLRAFLPRTPKGGLVPRVVHRRMLFKEVAGKRLVIVGDVHGCVDELRKLLDMCHYDS